MKRNGCYWLIVAWKRVTMATFISFIFRRTRFIMLCGINHNSYIFWQYPAGDRMPENRNWKEYNEHLIRRGEILFSLDFLEK